MAVLLWLSIQMLIFFKRSQSDCDKIDTATPDRRTDPSKLIICEYNAEFLFKKNCGSQHNTENDYDKFKEYIDGTGFWGLKTNDALIYEPAMVEHVANIAKYLDALVTDKGVDMFILIEVCDCGVLKDVITAMTKDDGKYRPYIVDQNNHFKVGIITRFDPAPRLGTDVANIEKISDHVVPRAIEAKFNLWTKTLWLYAAHLKANSGKQMQRYLQSMVIKMRANAKPATDLVIVVGDFNSKENTPPKKSIALKIKYESKKMYPPKPNLNFIVTEFTRVDPPTTLWYYKDIVFDLEFTNDGVQLKCTTDTSADHWYLNKYVTHVKSKKAGDTDVANYGQTQIKLNLVENADRAVFLTLNDGQMIKIQLGDWAHFWDGAKLTIAHYQAQKQHTLTLRENTHINCLQIASAPDDPNYVDECVTKLKYAGTTVEDMNYQQAVDAITAITAGTKKMEIELSRTYSEPFTVFTTAPKALINIRPGTPPNNGHDSKDNKIYTHTNCGESDPEERKKRPDRDWVIDYAMVSPLLNTKCAPTGHYIHDVGRQCGKYSDHDPILLKLTKPASWAAHSQNYADDYVEVDKYDDYINDYNHYNKHYNRIYDSHYDNYSSSNAAAGVIFISALILSIIFCGLCVMIGFVASFVFGLFIGCLASNPTIEIPPENKTHSEIV